MTSDPWIYRLVVASLGLVSLVSVIGFIFLGFTGHTPSDGLVAFGSGAIGALAGLLAPQPHATGGQ